MDCYSSGSVSNETLKISEVIPKLAEVAHSQNGMETSPAHPIFYFLLSNFRLSAINRIFSLAIYITQLQKRYYRDGQTYFCGDGWVSWELLKLGRRVGQAIIFFFHPVFFYHIAIFY